MLSSLRYEILWIERYFRKLLASLGLDIDNGLLDSAKVVEHEQELQDMANAAQSDTVTTSECENVVVITPTIRVITPTLRVEPYNEPDQHEDTEAKIVGQLQSRAEDDTMVTAPHAADSGSETYMSLSAMDVSDTDFVADDGQEDSPKIVRQIQMVTQSPQEMVMESNDDADKKSSLSDALHALYQHKFSSQFKHKEMKEDVDSNERLESQPKGIPANEHTPIWTPGKTKCFTLYNATLLIMLSLFMFMTGVQYNISQMISYHQSCEWHLAHTILAIEPTVLIAIIGLSCFISGVISDKFGRKTVMIAVVYMLSSGIIISGTARNIYQYESGRIIIGMSIGSLFNLCIVMWLESSPLHIRKIGILILMIFTSLGHASIVFYDSGIMVKYGWNWGMLSNLALMVPCTVLLHLSHETPLYLLASGHNEIALEVAKSCNMVERDLKGCGLIRERGNLRELFTPKYAVLTISLIFVFGLHRLVETGLIFGMPHLLAVNYCNEIENLAQNISTTPSGERCLAFSNYDYLFIFTFAILGIPGFFIGAFLQSEYTKMPIKYAILVLSIIVGILLVWCAVCDYYWLLEFKLGLLRVFISGQDQIFSVLIPAVFPTHIRNGGSGFVRACGIILSSVGPFLTIWFFNISVTWCLVVHAIIYFIRIPMSARIKSSAMLTNQRDLTDICDDPT